MSKTIGVVLALKDKCSPQLKAIADKMGITEKEARKLKKEIQKVSKEIGQGLKTAAQVSSVAIGSVVAGSTALVMKAGEVADRIDDMSNKIGISRQGFQEWDYLLAQNGANIESLQMGFKSLTNQIVAANSGNKESVKMFKALGISVKDSSGKLKTQEQVFNEVVVALQKMPEGAMKAKYANTLLGRSGSELMPLFNATTEQLERQREEYKKLGIEISDSAIDAGNKFGDSMEKLNSATASVTASLGAELLPVATDLLNTVIANMPQIKATVTPILQGIAGAVKFLVENMDILIAVGSGVVATFAAFKTITTVISIIQTLQTVIKAVSAAQGVWNALMLANPIGLVAVAVGALVAGVVYAYNKFEGFRNAVQAVWSVIDAVTKPIMILIQDFWKMVIPLIKVESILSGLGKWLKIAFMVSPIGAFITSLQLLVQNWDKVTAAVKSAFEWIKKVAGYLSPQAVGTAIGTKIIESRKQKTQKHAVGTTYSSGGLSLVGENGPELVSLPRGSSVASTDKTQKLMSGNNIKIEVNILGNMVGNNEFINQISDVFSMKLRTALQTV